MSKKAFYKGLKYRQDLKKEIGLKYQKVFEIIKNDHSVLEIGCHTGYLGEVLSKTGNKVWGVEIDNEAAQKAEPFYEKIIVGDIEDKETWNKLPHNFDVILFLDVLEHLIDPWEVLIKSKRFLKPEGFILVTLPNIAFYAIRKSLLLGKFDYQDSGILDKTHLRLFTFYSAQELIRECGYSIMGYYVTLSQLPFEYRSPFLKGFYNRIRPLFSKLFPNIFGAVILFKAMIKK